MKTGKNSREGAMGRANKALKERAIQRDAANEPKITAGSQRLWLRCGKCGHLMPGAAVTDHLAKCQPGGVRCSKCQGEIPSADFLAHILKCEGPKIVVLPREAPPALVIDEEDGSE